MTTTPTRTRTRSASPAPSSPHPPVAAFVAIAVVALVQLVLVLLFAWPASRATPHGLPLAVAGPEPAVSAVARGLATAQPGAFDVTVVADDEAARAAVTAHEVYGAVSLTGSGTTVYTATAASPAVAALLSQGLPAALHGADPDAVVTVTDLVPTTADDPHGAALPTALIPLAITSIAAGAVIGLLARGRRRKVAALLTYAVVAGAFSTFALQTILGGLGGSWWANAAVLGLVSLGVAATTTGLHSALGPAGIAVSAGVIFFVGFPFSGVTSAWELVPTPWGVLAQYLPVGAANTAVRSVAWFGGAGGTTALLVLGSWAAVGLAATALVRGRRTAH